MDEHRLARGPRGRQTLAEGDRLGRFVSGRGGGLPTLDDALTLRRSSCSVSMIVAESASSTPRTSCTSVERISSSVPEVNAASTRRVTRPTRSVTRSASARAACSRMSASRSASRRTRSVASVKKPDTIGSPLISIFDTVAPPGKCRRVGVARGRSVAWPQPWGCPSARAGARRAGRGTRGRMISARIGTPIASAEVQPKRRSAALFQERITPSRSSVMKASGAPSRTSRVRASLLERVRPTIGVEGLGPDTSQQARDQQARHERSSHGQQPANDRAPGSTAARTIA